MLCADGSCDGIVVAGDCTVTATRTLGSTKGKFAGMKLEPELLSINASGLDGAGESCTITVYVKTDLGAHKKMYTPTSCPVDLNSGVKVLDALKNLLLQDDDQLVFAGDNCNDA